MCRCQSLEIGDKIIADGRELIVNLLYPTIDDNNCLHYVILGFYKKRGPSPFTFLWKKKVFVYCSV
jgi:squalene cyclase